MSKRSKETVNKPVRKDIVLPKPQVPIGKKSSEELALLLSEQYKLIMQCQNNIAAITNLLEQRRTKAANMMKEAPDGKQGN